MDHYILLLKHLSNHIHFITNSFKGFFIDQLVRSKATCSFKLKLNMHLRRAHKVMQQGCFSVIDIIISQIRWPIEPKLYWLDMLRYTKWEDWSLAITNSAQCLYTWHIIETCPDPLKVYDRCNHSIGNKQGMLFSSERMCDGYFVLCTFVVWFPDQMWNYVSLPLGTIYILMSLCNVDPIFHSRTKQKY